MPASSSATQDRSGQNANLRVLLHAALAAVAPSVIAGALDLPAGEFEWQRYVLVWSVFAIALAFAGFAVQLLSKPHEL